MNFSLNVKITPNFNTSQIYAEIIQKTWFRFQELALELGEHLVEYMQGYINARSHRQGATGNLANAMKLDVQAGAGEAGVSWGIGHIPTLDKEAPYWRLLNFGGLTWAARTGTGVPGFFGAGNPPDKAQRGTRKGSERFNYNTGEGHFVMKVTNPIKGINYIEATRQRLDKEIHTIIKFLITHK
jgi:hypothetical protein